MARDCHVILKKPMDQDPGMVPGLVMVPDTGMEPGTAQYPVTI